MADQKEVRMISVNAETLRSVLAAFNGQTHELMEVYMTMNMDSNPVWMLMKEFNAWAEQINKEQTGNTDGTDKPTPPERPKPRTSDENFS